MDKKSAEKITTSVKEIVSEAHMGNLNGINTVNVTVKAEIPRIKMPPNTMVSQAFAKIASSRLKPVTCKLLIWIFGNSAYENYVSIDILSMAEELGYDQRSVLRAFKELVENNILQKFPHPSDKRRNDYFVNPFATWRGNSFTRLAHINEHEKIGTKMTLFDMSKDEVGYEELHMKTPPKRKAKTIAEKSSVSEIQILKGRKKA